LAYLGGAETVKLRRGFFGRGKAVLFLIRPIRLTLALETGAISRASRGQYPVLAAA